MFTGHAPERAMPAAGFGRRSPPPGLWPVGLPDRYSVGWHPGADHLKRYSKSRRQAPIYWPLSTASGSYTLWIYYHRLNDDTLFSALNRVKPKVDEVEKRLRQIESDLPNTAGREASKLRDALEVTKGFLEELREFRDELQRVAGLHYKPNLNDGVLITASP